MSTRTRRVQRLTHRIHSLPLQEETVQEAFELFQHWGELPTNDRVAEAVVQRALAGSKDEEDKVVAAARAIRVILDGGPTQPSGPNLRERLLEQTLSTLPALREPARLACRILSAKGGDLTDPTFLANDPVPEHMAVGLHCIGFFEKVVVTPYKAQARRLLARYDDLRERRADASEAWHEAMLDAAMALRFEGVMPEEGLLRDLVLADFEMECLLRHRQGQDVAEVMHLLDRVSRGDDAEHDEAIAKIPAIALSLTTGRT